MDGQTSVLPSGVKVTLDYNVLHCALKRTAEENLDLILKSLSVLYGMDITASFIFDGGGKIEFYRERG